MLDNAVDRYIEDLEQEVADLAASNKRLRMELAEKMKMTDPEYLKMKLNETPEAPLSGTISYDDDPRTWSVPATDGFGSRRQYLIVLTAASAFLGVAIAFAVKGIF